jgi:hypothetical protein
LTRTESHEGLVARTESPVSHHLNYFFTHFKIFFK